MKDAKPSAEQDFLEMDIQHFDEMLYAQVHNDDSPDDALPSMVIAISPTLAPDTATFLIHPEAVHEADGIISQMNPGGFINSKCIIRENSAYVPDPNDKLVQRLNEFQRKTVGQRS